MGDFKNLQGISLFQAVAASMADTFSQRTSPLTPKTSIYQPPMVLCRQFQYIFSISYQPPMVLSCQFQYIFSMSYQPIMVLHRQIQYSRSKTSQYEANNLLISSINRDTQSSTYKAYVRSLRITITSIGCGSC